MRASTGHGAQLPRTFLRPLGLSGSARSPYQAGLTMGPPSVLVAQHTRPLAPPSTPRPSPSPLLPYAPLFLLLPLRPVESPSLSLKCPLPPLGLPTNCPCILTLASLDFDCHCFSSRSADAMGSSGSRSRLYLLYTLISTIVPVISTVPAPIPAPVFTSITTLRAHPRTRFSSCPRPRPCFRHSYLSPVSSALFFPW